MTMVLSNSTASQVREEEPADPVSEAILTERPDRRAPRTPYPALVLIDGRAVAGRDISSSGLSVVLKPALAPGDVVRVTLAGAAGCSEEVSARVLRVEAGPEGFVVALQRT